uniref:Uncharacterized protein n=1 Tax=Rhizophora mucronata TaxID=61149 RepID=A0A2P2PHS6_RHIMU
MVENLLGRKRIGIASEIGIRIKIEIKSKIRIGSD